MASRNGYQRSDATERVERLLHILAKLLSRRPGSPLRSSDLASDCGCDEKTIKRDITLLRALLPITYDRAAHAYTVPDKARIFPGLALTPQDVLALALARNLLTAPGAPSAQAVASALDKATAVLPPVLKTLLSQAARTVQPGRLPRDYSAAPVDDLMQAVAQRQSVQIDYESRSRGTQAWRRVDPYLVEARAGVYWELHGWCPNNQAIRTFALDRIHGLRVEEKTFCVREAEWEAFKAESGVVGGLRGGEPVTVEVCFTPEVARYVRDCQWPETLTVEVRSDGGALLTGTVRGVDGIVTELLRWRRHARVLGGPELRARMAEEVRAIAVLYTEDVPEKGNGMIYRATGMSL